MPPTTPELEKANAELKKARATAAKATLQQWEIYGMPWNIRIKLMFLTGTQTFWLLSAAYMLWTVYQSQQKWNELVVKRPELATMNHTNYVLAFLPPLLVALCYPQLKQLKTVYKETDGFTELRKETVLFMALGIAIIVVLAATSKYWLSFLLHLL